MIKIKNSARVDIVIFKNIGGTCNGKFGNTLELPCQTCHRSNCSGCQKWDISSETPTFNDQDVINGEVVVLPGKNGLTCRGIKVCFVGELTGSYKRKKTNLVFKSESLDLECPSHVTTRSIYKFSIPSEAPYETYSGANFHVRYYIQATVLKRLGSKMTSQQEITIERPSCLPEVTRSFKMEAGNERSLQVEMECNKWRYHQNDVIKGFLKFLRVDIEIKKVELQIILRESEIDKGKESTLSQLIIWSQEILDGSPLDNGSIPIKVFLAPLSICPTAKNIEDKFCVRYYLKLIIVDISDNIFYKSQELTIFRKSNSSKIINKRRASSVDPRGFKQVQC